MRSEYAMSPVSRAGHAVMRERLMVVGVAAMLHATVFALGLIQTEKPVVMVNEMSVSFAPVQSAQTQVLALPAKSEPMRQASVDANQPAEMQTHPPVPAVGLASVTPLREDDKLAADTSLSAPVVLDTQPDYQADYLNNPRPSYPMVARRMGFHGKVVLNVEVLAAGRAGQVLLHASSGHDILDKAALQTVKTWRFTPARRLGQSVTEWFLVPINFSLEDSNA